MCRAVRAATLLAALAGVGCSAGEQPEDRTQSQQEAGPAAPQSTAPPSPPGYITGLVFEDRNGNGNYDTGDVRLADQSIVLSDPSGGRELATATTGADGAFRFEKLAPGEYRVTMQLPDGFTRANDSSFVLTVPEVGSPAEVQFGLVARR